VGGYEISQGDRACRSWKTQWLAEAARYVQKFICPASTCTRLDEPKAIMLDESHEFKQAAHSFLRRIAAVMDLRRTPETETVFGFTENYSAQQRSKPVAKFETFRSICCE
jgi:hypothetical protein